MNIVDRRPNPKGKSLSNRQRFLARARVEVKSAVQEALRKRKVADVEHGEKVAIPTRGITEPSFTTAGAPASATSSCRATRNIVRGDEIQRPQGGEGRGGSRRQPRRRRRRRVRVHAVEGRVPRPVLRGSRTARPGQEEPQGHHRGRSAARRLHRHRHARPISACRARCATSMARRISLQRPKLSEIEALREAARRGQGAAAPTSESRASWPRRSNAASGAARSSPISTRSMSATAASSGCRSRTPRR